MYKVKPYYDTSARVELPDCMYEVKSIYDRSLTNTDAISEIENDNVEVPMAESDEVDPMLVELEQRQEAILERLGKLKNEVDKLAAASVPSDCSSTISHKAASSNNHLADLFGSDRPLDIVVTADPSNPPLSVFVLCQWLAAHYRVRTAYHIHSSAPTDVAKDKLGLYPMLATDRWNAQIVLTVIWKKLRDGSDPMMTLSAVSQTPVRGEAVIARFLARLLPQPYDTDPLTATEIDHWLDQAGALSRGSSKEKAGVMRTLNARLGRHQWLVGDVVSLADVFVWAAMRGVTDGCTDNVQRWLGACATEAAIKSVMSMSPMEVTA